MLVLTRSPSQEIRIGHDIIVRVLDVKGDRVRIGIDAPNEVSVHRQEVYHEIEKANQEASETSTATGTGVIEIARSRSVRKPPTGPLRALPDPPSDTGVNRGA